MKVNLYSNHSDKKKIPFKLIIAQTDNMSVNYIIDPNDVIYTTNLEIDKTELNLGVVSIMEDNVVVNFNQTKGIDTAVSRSDNLSTAMIEIINKKALNAFSLRRLIKLCGGVVSLTPNIQVHTYTTLDGNTIDEKEELIPVDYDLSLENLSKDTILNLLAVDK
jgi:hypothetical protein